jgi:hypothetical protein
LVEENRFCSECGFDIAMDAQFCPNCGHQLPTGSSKQPDYHTRTQTQDSLPSYSRNQLIGKPYEEKQISDTKKILAVVGLIIGGLSLVVFSWLGLIGPYWMPFVFLAVSIGGVVFSAIGVAGNKALGITGVILNAIGAVIQAILVLFILFVVWVVVNLS